MNRFPATFAVRLWVGVALSGALSSPVNAQRGGTNPVAVAPDTALSSARSDARARARADTLRRDILRQGTFAGFAATPCGGSDMRTFERDSAGVVPGLLAKLELLVLSYGVSAPLDNEPGRALLRAMVRLEAGGPGPRWDVLTGAAPRSFNPILPSTLYDPQAKKCVETPGEEPDGLIFPPVTGFVAPSDSGTAAVHVRSGAAGMNQLRDLFFARFAADTTAVLRVTRINSYALWESYAIVSVVRERQIRGVTPVAGATTGAVYALHRVGREWRLLAMVRTW